MTACYYIRTLGMSRRYPVRIRNLWYNTPVPRITFSTKVGIDYCKKCSSKQQPIVRGHQTHSGTKPSRMGKPDKKPVWWMTWSVSYVPRCPKLLIVQNVQLKPFILFLGISCLILYLGYPCGDRLVFPVSVRLVIVLSISARPSFTGWY